MMLRLARVITTAVLLVAAPGGAKLLCDFDVDGDGQIDLALDDADGNGLCDFPDGKTHLHGVLRFSGEDRVEFHGDTIVEADRIVIEPGALLHGEPTTLDTLTMVAVLDDLASAGTLDLRAYDDLLLTARGTIVLTGPTVLGALDRVLIDARGGGVSLVPTGLSPGPPTVFGGRRIDVRAKGAEGVIELLGAGLASRRVELDAVANLSVIGAKELVLRDGTLLTTDPARTGVGPASDVLLAITGPMTVGPGALVDSGRNVRLSTKRRTDDACLFAASRVEARDPFDRAGRIYLTGVRGAVRTVGTVELDGQVLGHAPYVGGCGADQCDAVEGDEASAGAGGPVLADDATPTPKPRGEAVEVDTEAFLKAHNAVREGKLDPAPAAALKPFTWSGDLAAAALAYAETCPGCTHDKQRGAVGENLAIVPGTFTATQIAQTSVKLWSGEVHCYTYPRTCTALSEGDAQKKGCFKIRGKFDCCPPDDSGKPGCGHYTQIIWDTKNDQAETRDLAPKVGCGAAKCPDGQIHVFCRYTPAANVGDRAPYKTP